MTQEAAVPSTPEAAPTAAVSNCTTKETYSDFFGDDAAGVWTVVGFWWETWERWQDWYEAASAEQAEDLAHADAKLKNGHLWVCAVYPGKQHNADSARWIDPHVSTQEEMDRIRLANGYAQVYEDVEPEKKKRKWFG